MQMELQNFSPELQDKLAGKTPEDILALAKDEGYELTDKQPSRFLAAAGAKNPTLAQTAVLMNSSIIAGIFRPMWKSFNARSAVRWISTSRA